jgi:phytoene dehydrogenase-like protein
LPVAHPLDDGSAVVLERSVEKIGENLGEDGAAYRRLFAPLVRRWSALQCMLLGPLRFPRNPVLLARFGLSAFLPATTLSRRLFRQERARALFAGLAAHSMLPLELPVSAAFGLVLGISGHAVGWPIARGGAQQISDALVRYFHSLGGEILTAAPVEALEQLPHSRAVLFDLTPRQLLAVAGRSLPPRL